MSKIKVNLDFEELDKLPIEDYNELERKYLDFVQKLLISTEEDYCKKKGITLEEVKSDFKSYRKMRIAVDRRKQIKEATKNLMGFNKMLRLFTERNNDSSS